MIDACIDLYFSHPPKNYYLEVSVVWSGVTRDFLFGLFVEDDVEDEDEDSLEGVEDGKDDGQPLGPVREIGEPEKPGQSQNAEQRKWTYSCNKKMIKIRISYANKTKRQGKNVPPSFVVHSYLEKENKFQKT